MSKHIEHESLTPPSLRHDRSYAFWRGPRRALRNKENPPSVRRYYRAVLGHRYSAYRDTVARRREAQDRLRERQNKIVARAYAEGRSVTRSEALRVKNMNTEIARLSG